jgi:hypothetical protein
MLFVNYLTGSGAQVWSFVDTNGANIDASELTLLATMTGVELDSFDSTNFIA